MEYFEEVFQKIMSYDRKSEAVIDKNVRYTYEDLKNRVDKYIKIVQSEIDETEGAVVAIKSSMSFDAICLFFALCKCRCIVVPISENSVKNFNYYYSESKCDYAFDITGKYLNVIKDISSPRKHEYIEGLIQDRNSGLVVFSSGSSGKPKGAVHNINYIFEKFLKPRKKLRTLSFLLFDHLGGINTFIYVLSNGGCFVIPENKTVNVVLRTIQDYQVELLPTSPSFLNLVLVSEMYNKFDLASLKIISYGTEMMHKEVLKKLSVVFSNVLLQQTYGLTEIGVLRSKSLSNSSLWVKLGGKEFKTRVQDGKLEIKGKSTMLGYLNAENPFTDDGWLKTGDNVLVDGDYFKILGRDSDIINVGGQKVYPSEVENLILSLEEVADAVVYGEKNSLLGYIVCAKIVLKDGVLLKDAKSKIKKSCKSQLEKFKIPVKILSVNSLVGNRYKKVRS